MDATKSFLRAIYKDESGRIGPSWAGGHVWLTEIGARYKDTTRVYGEDLQAQATAFILHLPDLDGRITRIYYYDFVDTHERSTGLLTPRSAGHPSATPRAAYRMLRAR
jgi:hypothetical protein